MSMNLPIPLNPVNAPSWKRLLEQADADNQKRNADFIINKNRLILTDSAGAKWSVTVSTSGQLTTTKL